MKKVIFVLSILLFIIGCTTQNIKENTTTNINQSNTSMIEFKQTEDFYYCEDDEDCMIVQQDCKGCISGGKATAIHMKYEIKWNEIMFNVCSPSGGVGAGSHHISCFSNSKCINNTCTLIPNKEYLCSSHYFTKCIYENDFYEIDKEILDVGITCREIFKICEPLRICPERGFRNEMPSPINVERDTVYEINSVKFPESELDMDWINEKCGEIPISVLH